MNDNTMRRTTHSSRHGLLPRLLRCAVLLFLAGLPPLLAFACGEVEVSPTPALTGPDSMTTSPSVALEEWFGLEAYKRVEPGSKGTAKVHIVAQQMIVRARLRGFPGVEAIVAESPGGDGSDRYDMKRQGDADFETAVTLPRLGVEYIISINGRVPGADVTPVGYFHVKAEADSSSNPPPSQWPALMLQPLGPVPGVHVPAPGSPLNVLTPTDTSTPRPGVITTVTPTETPVSPLPSPTSR